MKLTVGKIRKVIIYLIILVSVGGFSYRLGEYKSGFYGAKNTSSSYQQVNINGHNSNLANQSLDLTLFWEVYRKIREGYLDRSNIDPVKLVNGAISGMVSALGDPYTVFLPASDNQEAKDDLRGDFEGVGIQIGFNKDQQVTVVAPLSETPAERAGIKAGDVILKIIDDKNNVNQSTEGMSLPDAVKLIRGPKGSSVKLLLSRTSQAEPFEKTLKRDTIVVKSVEVKFITGNNEKEVAWLKLSRFGDRTDAEWAAAVRRIKDEEAKNSKFAGVILDLRNNPGGYLDGAVSIGSEFLNNGVIVEQDEGNGNVQKYEVNRSGQLTQEPVAVLVNEGSASASEIVAGALQEAKRAKVIGVKSFGKGTVQQAEDLEGGAGIHITVARWLLASGKSIDKEGIVPDIEIFPDETDQAQDRQLDKAIEVLVSQ